jgi:CRP-like cAMP-binding protein
MAVTFSDQLARVSLFAELTREDLAELAASARVRRYVKDQIIFGQGDPGTHLYVVASGRVAVGASSVDGRFLAYHTFGPAEVFGEFAVLDGQPRSADAIALEPSELLLLSGADFLRCLRSHPDVTIRLLLVMIRRIRDTNEQAIVIAFSPVSERLAKALLDLAETRAGGVGQNRTRTFRVTQTELATQIGATRETVNRSLSDFEAQGLIRSQRGQVTIISPDGLRTRIN